MPLDTVLSLLTWAKNAMALDIKGGAAKLLRTCWYRTHRRSRNIYDEENLVNYTKPNLKTKQDTDTTADEFKSRTDVLCTHPIFGPPLMRSKTWAGFKSCLNLRSILTPWKQKHILTPWRDTQRINSAKKTNCWTMHKQADHHSQMSLCKHAAGSQFIILIL